MTYYLAPTIHPANREFLPRQHLYSMNTKGTALPLELIVDISLYCLLWSLHVDFTRQMLKLM